jgi:hypothetical protein
LGDRPIEQPERGRHAVGDALRRARQKQHRLGAHFRAGAIDDAGETLQPITGVGGDTEITLSAVEDLLA